MDIQKELEQKYMELGAIQFLTFAARKGYLLANADGRPPREGALSMVDEFMSEQHAEGQTV